MKPEKPLNIVIISTVLLITLLVISMAIFLVLESWHINDELIINYTGKQKVLIQKISKTCFIINNSKDSLNTNKHFKILSEDLKELEFNQKKISENNESKKINSNFKDFEKNYSNFNSEIKNFLNNSPVNEILDRILKSEADYYEILKEIHTSYSEEKKNKMYITGDFIIFYDFILIVILFFVVFKKIKPAIIQNIKLTTAIEQSPTGIMITDAQGKIEYINPKFSEMTGYSKADVKNKTSSILKSNKNADIIYKELWETINNKEVWTGELINKRKNGTEYTESSIISPVINSANKVINYISIKEDVTEKKEAERKVHEYTKQLQILNANKDLFIQILAHDLKNPFNSLLGLSAMLLKNLRKYDLEKIEKNLSVINQTARSTYNLLTDILLWSQSQAGKLEFVPQKVEIHKTINEIKKELEHIAVTKNIKVTSATSEEIFLKADENMIKTILRNLLTNALKFSYPESEIKLTVIKNAYQAEITISDKGVGIDKNTAETLFDSVSKTSTLGTANESGTGFGLNLCKEFVEKHSGKIWVESEIERGSDFKFTIPLYNF